MEFTLVELNLESARFGSNVEGESAGTAEREPSATDETLSAEPASESDGGSGRLLFVLALVGLAAAGAVAVLLWRRRRDADEEPEAVEVEV